MHYLTSNFSFTFALARVKRFLSVWNTIFFGDNESKLREPCSWKTFLRSSYSRWIWKKSWNYYSSSLGALSTVATLNFASFEVNPQSPHRFSLSTRSSSVLTVSYPSRHGVFAFLFSNYDNDLFIWVDPLEFSLARVGNAKKQCMNFKNKQWKCLQHWDVTQKQLNSWKSPMWIFIPRRRQWVNLRGNLFMNLKCLRSKRKSKGWEKKLLS